MSLSSILSEIQGDVDDIPLDTNVVAVAKENISDSPAFTINYVALEEAEVYMVNTSSSIRVIREQIKNMPRIDYKIAQEVFAMLPMTSETDRAKITTAPSVMNKEVIEKITSSANMAYSAVSGELQQKVAVVIDDIRRNTPNALALSEYLNNFLTAVEADKERHRTTSPIVMCDVTPYNLYETSVYDIACTVRDDLSNYPPYEGKLTSAFCKLYDDPTLDAFLVAANCRTTTSRNVSLESFIDTVTHALAEITSCLRLFEDRVTHYEKLLEKGMDDFDEEIAKLVNSAGFTYRDLLYVKTMYDITVTKDNAFDKVVALMAFLH